MRCDKCKHWGRPNGEEDHEARRAGMKQCMALRLRDKLEDEVGAQSFYTGNGVRDADAYMTACDNKLIEARAYVQDGSSYMAELITRPDFFCALFSPLEQESRIE